jgi:hypothetical protein
MSIKVIELALDADIPTTQRFVLVVLAKYANDMGRRIFPAISTVAEKTGLSTRAVQGAMRALTNIGVLQLVRESIGGRGHTSVYAINMERLGELAGGTGGRQNPAAGAGFNGAENPAAGAGFSVNPAAGAQNPAAAAPESSSTVKNEVESCVTSESSAREAETDVAEHTTAPPGIVLPFIKAGGDRLPMLVGWVPPEDWRRWGVAEGHPDIDAGCAAFRALWLRRQIQGTAGPPKTKREWWVQFSGWILSDIDQGRYHGQRDDISGAGSDRSASFLAAAAAAGAAVERMEASRRSTG